jgi:serralysin
MPIRLPPTGNQSIDGILWDGWRWDTTNLTFAFPIFNGDTGYFAQNFAAFNSAQANAAIAALANYSAVCGLTFTQSNPTVGNIRFALATAADMNGDNFLNLDNPESATYEGIVSALANPPDPDASSNISMGDSWYNSDSGFNPIKGNFHWGQWLLHEMGHAVGLDHGHSDHFGSLPVNQDTMEYSVMTYRQFVEDPILPGIDAEEFGFSQTLMQNDIAALQYLYGANFDTNSGNTVYTWSPTTGEMFIDGVGQLAPGANRIFLTVWDGNGVDTYNFTNYGTNLIVDLNPGAWTTVANDQLAILNQHTGVRAQGNIANALLVQGDPRSLIENATAGNGNDVLTGNVGQNLLIGNGGNDRLDGGAGSDTLNGGVGNDVLIGGAGNDDLIGGTGIDQMSGGQNNDLYHVDDEGDVVIENANEGIADLVHTALAAHTLSANVENLTFTGVGSFTGTGNAGNNIITGGAGVDILTGRDGADQLIGGADDDFLFFDSADTAVHGNSGVDRAVAFGATGVSLDLGIGGIEWLWGTNAGDNANAATQTATVVIFGLGGNDIITGGSAADQLYGQDGADSIFGGNGDDWLYIDSFDFNLNGGIGSDRSSSLDGSALNLNLGTTSIEWVWASNHADNLNGSTNVQDLFLFGFDGADVLTGGSGNDNLLGQAGADQMIGGNGNDVIYFDSDDTVVNGGNGQDTAQVLDYTGVGVSLNLITNGIETVYASNQGDSLNGAGATWSIFMNGFNGNDTMTGGNLADNIYGGGGSDTIAGGGGNDFLDGNGGGGTDTLLVQGNRADYILHTTSAVVTSVQDLIAGRDGWDNIAGFEQIQFNDQLWLL